MWTADNRPRYNRDKLRYPSDLTDAEWAHIEPLIPPGKPGGGKRRVARRRARGYPRGDQRRDVHSEHRLPVARAAQGFAAQKPPCMITSACGTGNGTLDRIHHALYLKCREKAAREASPHGLHHRQSECEKR